LVLMNDWRTYTRIGQTRDDAAGEAFDKIARILGLPYPGGPEISKMAAEARKKGVVSAFPLPRPMLKSPDFDFSFSGLKTAALYAVRDIEKARAEKTDGNKITASEREQIALETENAITEVLVAKTAAAIKRHWPKTLVVAGGVSANGHIRAAFRELVSKTAAALSGQPAGAFPDLILHIPTSSFPPTMP